MCLDPSLSTVTLKQLNNPNAIQRLNIEWHLTEIISNTMVSVLVIWRPDRANRAYQKTTDEYQSSPEEHQLQEKMADFAQNELPEPTPQVAMTPHIEVNSGEEYPFIDADEGDVASSQHLIGRALTPGIQIPPSPSSACTFQSSMTSPTYAQESSEFLIPPRPSYCVRDEMDQPTLTRSPDLSIVPSRRTSWSSMVGSHDIRTYWYSPFGDSRAPSRTDSYDSDVNTQTVSEKYNIMPMEGLLLFPEDVEKDDYLHNPDAGDRDRRCDLFNRRGLMNIGGLTLLTLGFLTLFIGYPVMYVFFDPGG